MDRRIRKSRESLKNALLNLLRQKSLHQIQIKELCEMADVNRSTFYNNYTDINEILTDIYQDTIHIITSQVIHLSNMEKVSQEEFRQAICRAFVYFQENDDYFSLLFSQPAEIQFERLLCLHYMKNYRAEHLTLERRYFLLQQIIGSFSIIRAWMSEGYPISAQELTNLIINMFPTQFIATLH